MVLNSHSVSLYSFLMMKVMENESFWIKSKVENCV